MGSSRSSPPKKVLVVFPTAWDRKNLPAAAARWSDRFEIVWGDPSDEDCPSRLDIVGYIERQIEASAGRIDGVVSSSDYPGATVAGAVATALGLPGTPPATLLRCSHKYYSRRAQRRAAPDAVPWFVLVDPAAPRSARGLRFPCYVKPVKGAFSILSRRVESLDELESFLRRPIVEEFVDDYLFIFNELVRHFTRFERDGRWFLAEGLLAGELVTVEGFALRGRVELVGIVDSRLYPGRRSFWRFDYPSRLGPGVQRRLFAVAERVMTRLGFRDGLFNVEMTYDAASDRIGIVEVNPRMCGQFAELYASVDGTSSYELAFEIATNGAPRIRRGAGPYRVATSVALRVFEPVRVVEAPGPERIAEIERRFPGTRIWSECVVGQELADFERNEDGASARYAVVGTAAESEAALAERLDAIERALGYAFEPL